MNHKDQKTIQEFINARLELIADMRNKVIDAGGVPNVMYIGDILEHEAGKMYISPMQLNTGCKALGMLVIMDFRVPQGEIYIMQGAFNV